MKVVLILFLLIALIHADFTFISMADTRGYHSGGLSTGMNKAAAWNPKFAVCPGDMDPMSTNNSIIQQHLGPNFPWFNAVGNHETEDGRDMDSVAAFGLNWVNEPGFSDFTYGPSICPNTTFSFVYTGPAGIKIQAFALSVLAGIQAARTPSRLR